METKTSHKHRPRRKAPFQLVVMRLFFKGLGRLFPTLAGGFAYRLWFGTRRFPTPKREQAWLKTAKSEVIEINGLPVMTHYWENTLAKSDAPLVLLVHGWDGRGSQLGAFAGPLLQAGFRVLAYDNPAHGQTPGKSSTLLIHSDVQQALVNKVGPLYGIIAHSFGGMFSAYSLSKNMQAKKVVCISAPTDFMYLVERYCGILQLPEKVKANIIARINQQFGEDIAQRVSATTTSKVLGHIPALIIHDEDDRDVPIVQSENLHQHWPGSRLVRTAGLGHRRILYNPQVIETTVNFLK